MSPKPLSMKALSKISQKPMVSSETVIKPATIDSRHAAELARRASVQRTSNVKPPAGKK